MRLRLIAVSLASRSLAAQNSSLAPRDTGAVTIHAATMIDAHLHPGWYINRDGGPEDLDLRDA